MTKIVLILKDIFLLYINCFGQSIVATLSGMPGQEISLIGFRGFETYPISQTIADSNGTFLLTYGSDDFGMGYLAGADDSSFFDILSGDDVELNGESLAIQQGIDVIKGQSKLQFEQYASKHLRREQTLSAGVPTNIYT